MNLRTIILAPLLPLALAGCNEAIDTVKNGRMKINEQYTVDYPNGTIPSARGTNGWCPDGRWHPI